MKRLHPLYVSKQKSLTSVRPQHVDKPSHSFSVLRAGTHKCHIRFAPVLVLPRLQRFSITLKRRQRAKIKFILALCQQSEGLTPVRLFLQLSIKVFFDQASSSLGKVHQFVMLEEHVVSHLHHDRYCCGILFDIEVRLLG
ncbi:hypothetical protein C883_3251 [Bacillus stratosphericus LAMA 585]|nr:hypothetical protein C883_3251 [Bacillus stratosphericus LAMA 585]